jgi:hypothetical protein
MATGSAQEVEDKLNRITSFTTYILEDVLRLKISVKKSVVTASTPKLAAAIARTNTKKNLKPVHSAKLLGTATTAGARRCTKVLKNRLISFKVVRKRINKLRSTGVNTVMMARAAGTQAVTYGYATTGVADSALLATRREVAKAGAPTTAGKNPNLVLYTFDAATGTLDPAFEAIAAGIHAWASAWWDKWIPEQQLVAAFNAASTTAKKGWNSVSGPVAAMTATLKRVGWRMTDATTFVDDLGEVFHVRKDSPEAIRLAVNRSTRRWRLAEAGRDLPGLIPSENTRRDGDSNPRATSCSRSEQSTATPPRSWARVTPTSAKPASPRLSSTSRRLPEHSSGASRALRST